jgi:hypothetical protein
MSDLIVVTKMPGPNMWSAEHGRGEVVARTLVNCYLAVVLACRRLQSICPEVRRVPGEVVTVFVIKNPGVVRSISAIRPTRRLHQRAILKEISTWAEMDLPVWRNRFVLV